MAERLEVDICVIGAGSGGLSVAAGASQLGMKVVLCEAHKMGGDCLNYGCVPSKALIAAARAAQNVREAQRFGVTAGPPQIDFAAVRAHVQGVIAAIAPMDSVERFTGLGVRVIQAMASFVAPDLVRAGDVEVRARRFVIATGSRAVAPPIAGLESVPYLTNETVFDLDVCPGHLLVIGGGPIGCELAQAFRRLGAQVTVLEAASLLGKDDPELADFVRRRLIGEGVDIIEGAQIAAISGGAGAIEARLAGGKILRATHLLVAAGRKANVEGLNLEAAGVRFSPKGIEVDARLRTSNPKIFAMGDVAGGPQFTHVAGYHAGIVIRNALFRLPAKIDYRALPWVTYTEPELANVGLTEAAARRQHGDAIRILRWPFHENDRAQTERDTEGLVKVIATPKGQVLGAGIVGAQAGELIQVWGLALSKGLKVKDIASLIAPYPTRGEAGKRAAGSFFLRKLFGAGTKRLVRFLARFG
jgi:pyruvate/2-oxoglutarate dehydrogenase complex dihydrolipoamide dehydrogenase (E3) component